MSTNEELLRDQLSDFYSVKDYSEMGDRASKYEEDIESVHVRDRVDEYESKFSERSPLMENQDSDSDVSSHFEKKKPHIKSQHFYNFWYVWYLFSGNLRCTRPDCTVYKF